MNPSIRNAVVAGIVALVVAVGVLWIARAISPDNSEVSSVVVTAPDGSVLGHTAPIHASSGPPVPACVTTNTVLTCEGVGVPFGWHFPIGGGDSGIANEAFGPVTTANIDAGFTVIGLATLTPSETGEISVTSSFEELFDAGCPFEGGVSENNGVAIAYGVHNGDAAASQPIATSFLNCVNGLTAGGSVVSSHASGAISGLSNDGGTSYDFLLLGGGKFGITVTDASTGGIWVHEVP